MRKLLLVGLVGLLLSCNCNQKEWRFKKGDLVEQKLVKGLLVVQDTITKNNEQCYKLISGTGTHRVIEEYKLYKVELNEIH
ncbi:MAG: hypothetical protein ACK5EG_08665 [Chitinophagaceae bacterium]